MQTVIHSVTTASEVIQLAIAPVFLLMGVRCLAERADRSLRASGRSVSGFK